MYKKNFDTKNKSSSKNNKGLEFLYIKVCRSDLIAESKDSVLLSIDEFVLPEDFHDDDCIWISKKYVFPSQYTNKVSITLVKDWKYQLTKSNKEATGETIYKWLNDEIEG